MKTIDFVLLNLNRVKNACLYLHNTPCSIERTQRGVPYVKVGGSGKVRVVFFARTGVMRVFFNLLKDEPQMRADFKIRQQSDEEYKAVARFAVETLNIIES